MKVPTKSNRSGFSLIELVITMTILAILVGVVSFRSGGVVERSKVTKIISLVGTLKTASALYHADTGSYPYEYTGYAASHRKLSGTQTTAGWSGPYIEGPLANNNHNPYGGLHMYNRVTANNWITGFDVDGDGTEEVTYDGCMLYLAGITQAVADQLESTFDQGVPGAAAVTGRVRYDSGAQRALILVYN